MAGDPRSRLRASVERGDPWPGFALGLLVALLASLAFALDFGPAVRADLAALDLAIAWRTPVQAHPDLLLVEIDEGSLRANDQVKSRLNYARALRTLDHLGAGPIAFDVEYIARTDTARYLPDGTFEDSRRETEVLAHAIRRAGRVLLGVRSDPNPLWERHEAALRRLADALEKAPVEPVRSLLERGTYSEHERAALLSAADESLRFARWLLVERRLRAKPESTFPEIRDAVLGPPATRSAADVNELLDSYLSCLTGAALDRGSPALEVESTPPDLRNYPNPAALNHLLAGAAQGLGSTVTLSQDEDGVLRRIPTLAGLEGRPRLYLGTLLGIRTLESKGAKVALRLHRRVLEIRISGPGGDRVHRQPLLEDGSSLANWAGRPGEWGDRGPEFYHRVPIQRLVEFALARWDELYGKLADLATSVNVSLADQEKAPSELLAGFLAVRGRWEEARRSAAVPESEVRALERELDDRVGKLLPELPALVAATKRDPATLPPRMAKAIREAEESRDALHALVLAQREAVAGAEARLRPLVQGRGCLVGTTSKFGGDLHSTAMGRGQPGVELQMTAANMAMTGGFLRYAPGWVSPLLVLAMGALAAAGATYLGAIRSSGAAVLLVGLATGGYLLAFSKAGLVLSAAGPPASILLAFATSMTYRQLVTLRSQKRLRKELESKMSPQVVAAYMANPEAFSRPRKIVATVFFSDVKGFTSISEGMDPERLVAFINRYLDRMTRIHLDCHGFIDKYIGDGIMALYGAPIEDPRHALRAAGAALANLQALAELNAEIKVEGLPELKMRAGLHTGELVAAKIGSRDRADLTAMGDTVNLASRLEGANKLYGTAVMVSESTRERIEGQFQFRELDTIRVVGKKKPVKVYELLAQAGRPSPLPAGFLEAWNAGLEAYRTRGWEEAAKRFHQAEELRRGDEGCLLYIDRIIRHQMHEPPADWEPVHSLDAK